MFPTKEAGDFFNNEVILIKYLLDLEDPDGIMEKYAIRAYPTFILINGNGEEYSRFIGGANTTEAFLEKTKNALKRENSWAYRNEKLKADPSYTVEHIRYLNSVYMQDPAREMLNGYFATRSIQENFSEESVQLYNSLITDTNSPIVEFMLKNQGAVSQVMGAEQYKSFLISKANSQIGSKFTRVDLEKAESVSDFEGDVKKLNAHPLLSSKYSQFVLDNFGNIKAKNDEAIFNNLKKSLPDFSTAERQAAFGLHAQLARVFKITIDPDVTRQRSIALYEIAVETEKDERALENFKRTLDRLKNPQ